MSVSLVGNDLVDKSSPEEKRELHDALYERFDRITEWVGSFGGRPWSDEAEAFNYMQDAVEQMGYYILEEKRDAPPPDP